VDQTFIFSRWQRRVIAALMQADERWCVLAPPKGARWTRLVAGDSECPDAQRWSRGYMWRRRARAIERRWPPVWGAWLESGLWRGDWRAELRAMVRSEAKRVAVLKPKGSVSEVVAGVMAEVLLSLAVWPVLALVYLVAMFVCSIEKGDDR